MSQELLSHTLTVKVSPSLQADLATASDREGVSCGAIVRRAVRTEIDVSVGRALQPFSNPSYEQTRAHLDEALSSLGDEAALEALTFAIGDEISDLIEAAIQTLDVIHDASAPQRFERAAGYLKQGNEALLRAVSRVRALRVRRGIESGKLAELEERIRSDAQAEEHE